MSEYAGTTTSSNLLVAVIGVGIMVLWTVLLLLMSSNKKENATLEEDFFVRTKDELVPVEVKANKNRSKSLRKLIDNESYSDIKWGIKLADSNVGIENGIYTFPYFCSFLIKRYLAKKG